MSDPGPAGQTRTIYDGKTLREVIQMCEQAHACANELQRQLSETQQLCVELEQERDAAQATLSERTEDAQVLSDKLRLVEMDNYTKDSAIEDLSQRIKDQAKKLSERDAVITAMRGRW